MTGQDVDRLFDLLAIFRPGDKHLGDKQLRSAWLFVLKPYEPEDVREAVAEYFRESSYWPDVTEIAKRCPKIMPKITKDTRANFDPETDRHWKQQVELFERYGELKRRRREAGLPESWWDAKDSGGWTLEQYDKALDEAGLGYETIL